MKCMRPAAFAAIDGRKPPLKVGRRRL